MDNLQDILRSSDVIKASFEVSRELGQKVYLVGGSVRDLLMDSALGKDYDFVVEGKGIPFARSFADKVSGSFFVLDEERDTSRVVSKKGFQADFSGIRGSIEGDLRLRDFTINSMAIPLDSVFAEGISLIDPLEGMRDMRDKVLRASSADSLKEDPLRLLRAFRFSSAFGLEIDGGLAADIRAGCEMLRTVSVERVRAEIFMILDMPGAYRSLQGMGEVGVLKNLFPEVEKWKGFYQGGWHAYDLFEHSMKTVEALEEVLSDLKRHFPRNHKEIDARIGEEVEAYVTRRGLLKLASLLHDSGKFYTRVMEGGRGRFLGHEKEGEGVNSRIAWKLKLGRRSEMVLLGLTRNHMRILALSKLKKVTERARFRFFRDTEGFSLDLLILSIADAMATPIGRRRFDELKRIVEGLADYYFDEYIAVPPRPLLTGDDIMRIFGIPQGKKVGEMLDALREAEATGKVSNKKEAVAHLKKVTRQK
jgi:tRNA nucleotidyltransferase/poly(A) polymerase